VLALATSNIRLIRALHKRSQERGRYAAAARLRTVRVKVKGKNRRACHPQIDPHPGSRELRVRREKRIRASVPRIGISRPH
jgi:hypothetical protein